MKIALSVLCSLSLVACRAPSRHDGPEPHPTHQPAAQEARSGTSEEAAAMLARIIHDNALFAAGHDDAYFAPFQEGQHPHATVVACADSRFHIQAIDSAPDGDIFEIRNIGNLIDGSEGSVEYGIRHLHTPLLLIIGHVGCGAVKAALGDYSGEPPPIRRELDGLHLSLRHAAEKAGSFEERWLSGVIDNVHQQVADALSEYGDVVGAGELFVVGAVYDFRGDLGGGRGKLQIIDINGESRPDRIAESALLLEVRRLIESGGRAVPRSAPVKESETASEAGAVCAEET